MSEIKRIIGTTDIHNRTFAMGFDHTGGHRYVEDVLYQLPDGTYLLRREVTNDAGDEWIAFEDHILALEKTPQEYVCEHDCFGCSLQCPNSCN